MQRKWITGTAVGIALALAMAGGVDARVRVANNSGIAAAVAAPGRGAENVKLDASRKPAELLTFLGLRPGMKVADPFGGNLYWAEITSRVVGRRPAEAGRRKCAPRIQAGQDGLGAIEEAAVAVDRDNPAAGWCEGAD